MVPVKNWRLLISVLSREVQQELKVFVYSLLGEVSPHPTLSLSPVCTPTLQAENDLELLIFPPLPSKCWGLLAST